MKTPMKVLFAVVLAIGLLLVCMCPLSIMLAMLSDPGATGLSNSRYSSPAPQVPEARPLDSGEFWLALDTVENYEDVFQANVDQDGNTLRLLLVVETRGTASRDRGDDFVRAVASFADPIGEPGVEIGPTLYDYEVVVTNLNGEAIFEGHKDADEEGVIWE